MLIRAMNSRSHKLHQGQACRFSWSCKKTDVGWNEMHAFSITFVQCLRRKQRAEQRTMKKKALFQVESLFFWSREQLAFLFIINALELVCWYLQVYPRCWWCLWPITSLFISVTDFCFPLGISFLYPCVLSMGNFPPYSEREAKGQKCSLLLFSHGLYTPGLNASFSPHPSHSGQSVGKGEGKWVIRHRIWPQRQAGEKNEEPVNYSVASVNLRHLKIPRQRKIA